MDVVDVVLYITHSVRDSLLYGQFGSDLQLDLRLFLLFALLSALELSCFMMLPSNNSASMCLS